MDTQGVLEPQKSERITAAAMHGISLFMPFLGPAAFYVTHRRRSQFVACHALQALYEAIVLKLLLLLALVCSLSYTVYRLITLYQNDWQGFSWQEFLVRFLLGWLALGLLALITGAITVVQAYKAYSGQWPRQARLVSRVHKSLGR